VAASAFLDPAGPPDAAAVAAALGARAPLWDALVAFVGETCGATTTWVHEGRATGWALRAVRAGRPFAVLYPEPDVAAIRIVIGEKDRDAAFALPLGPRIGETLREARRYPDGTWVYARPETMPDVTDLCRLLAVKLPPTIRARVRIELDA
jgi:hypothetical protein